ncbi:hypothetical protein [Pseudoalteromonas umbrosa]|uniref:hypothetical protein n=1 Tax=Pseudoalteromonas umbrosa TaxID=3048489 RepID=UPI0024C43E99|nr:hypothetical protein [Pseudoalteromonas sp. B95]MDK1286928.1 hypothetical protein [Pseudoalteromonas sp. B95]
MSIKVLAVAGILSIFSFDSFAVMDLTQYKQRAFQDNQPWSRCSFSTPPNSWQQYINHALNRGFITQRAANWGRSNGYYPVISFFGGVEAVCSAK